MLAKTAPPKKTMCRLRGGSSIRTLNCCVPDISLTPCLCVLLGEGLHSAFLGCRPGLS